MWSSFGRVVAFCIIAFLAVACALAGLYALLVWKETHPMTSVIAFTLLEFFSLALCLAGGYAMAWERSTTRLSRTLQERKAR